MRNLQIKFVLSILIAAVFGLGFGFNANAQAQRPKIAFSGNAVIQQPLYMEYRGVRLGMTATEARAKLGTPALQASDQDYYVFTENESAQIGYDAAQKVITISVDFLGGIGAPDHRAVVGGELEATAHGSLYRIVRYPNLGFWVSYNRMTTPVATVTLTIQKDLFAGAVQK